MSSYQILTPARSDLRGWAIAVHPRCTGTASWLTGHIDHSVTGMHYARLTADDLRPTLQRIANEIKRLLKDEAGGKVIQLSGYGPF